MDTGSQTSTTFLGWHTGRWALAIAGFSAALCIGYAFAYRIQPVVDARAYDTIAQNIVDGHGFREDRTTLPDQDPGIIRAGPLYEYVLAGSFAAFGHRYEPIWILQGLLHGLSVLLLYAAAVRLFGLRGRVIGLVAAAIFGLWPDLIEISAMLMTETLYLSFTVLLLYLFSVAQERWRNVGVGAALGIAGALGTLTRPPLLLVLVVACWPYVRRRATLPLLAAVAAFGLAAAPWVARNYRIYDRFVLTTMIGEVNVWAGNTPGATGGQVTNGSQEMADYFAQHGFRNLPDKSKEVALEFVRQHPGQFVQLVATRLVRFCSLARPMGFWFYQSGLPQLAFAAASGLWIAAAFVLGLAGFILWLMQRQPASRWYLLAMAAVAPAVLLPTVVQSRYRFQIYPFVALAAAYALSQLRVSPKVARRAIAGAAAALVLLTLVDAWSFADVIRQRLLG